jgi:microcystin-dependent protein
MNTLKYVIIGIIILLALLFLYDKQENITSTDSGKTLSDEALQNIASVYNTQNMTVTNLNITAWKGMVTMWSGDINKIPTGWALCDGTQGTPDLRGRFVLGYNKDQPINRGSVDAGGWVTTNTGARLNFEKCNQIGMNGGEPYHTLSVGELPPHNHSYSAMRNDIGSEYYNGSVIGYSYPNWWALKANGSPTGNTGNGEGHNNIPPYLVLAYIMKL